MLIDSHAHLDFYTERPTDRDEVLRHAWDADVKTILAIGIGEGPATMHQALEMAKSLAQSNTHNLPRVFATAGIHPSEASQASEDALKKVAALAADPLSVAIGEIGLDYYHADNPDIPTQQLAFTAQMYIAAQAKKPIIIHCRTSDLATPQAKQKFGPADAWADVLAHITEHFKPTGPTSTGAGIMHCFSGNVEDARRSLDLGFYLSFAGNLTYPKAQSIREAAAFAPADRILVETDAPFLAPIPLRGQRNEPAYVAHTAAALAELRRISPEELAATTTENFHRLFPSTKPNEA